MTKSLPTGFTDNTVTQIDGLVVKTGGNAIDEYIWYHSYKDKSDIPMILGIKDKSLVMDYIERSGELNVQDIIGLVEKYKNYEPLNNYPFAAYIDRIRVHLSGNIQISNGEKLLSNLYSIFLAPTFSHGDFSVYNVIPSSTGLKMIDPLYSRSVFGNYILDYAKMLFSLKFYANDIRLFNKLKEEINIPYIDTLIASECVRVATYKKQFSFIAENLINEL